MNYLVLVNNKEFFFEDFCKAIKYAIKKYKENTKRIISIKNLKCSCNNIFIEDII